MNDFLSGYKDAQRIHDTDHIDTPDIDCDICWEEWERESFDWPNGETSIDELAKHSETGK